MISAANIFLIWCLSFLAVVGLGNFLTLANFILFLIFLTSAGAAVFCFRDYPPSLPSSPLTLRRINSFSRLRASYGGQVLIFLSITLAGLSLGLLRFNATLPKENSVSYWRSGQTSFSGQVAADPQIKDSTQKIILEKIVKNGQLASDKILISTGLYPRFVVGENLAVNCELKKPQTIDNFDYANYLADRGVYQVCYYPEIRSLGLRPAASWPDKIKYFFSDLRKNLAQRANKFLSSPAAALNLAMILGERNELTEELNNYFSHSGVIHIISISGTHIALLSTLIFQLFLFLGLSRQKSFKFIVVILVLYLFLIGFNAPAIRSALMGLLLAWAQKEGRLASAGRAVVAAAVFLLLLNPRLLLGDIGFQLSFLAVFGLIYLAPYVAHFLRRFIRQKNLLNVLAMTLAAQIITWPLTVWRFETFSVIAPLTNVLILAIPAVEILMVAGFVFLLAAGLGLAAPLIFIFSTPVFLAANYVIFISAWCAKIPVSHLSVSGFNFFWVLVSYAVMGMIYFLVKRKVVLEE